MARLLGGVLGLLLCGILAGCGINAFMQREPWRGAAEEECLARKLVQPSAYAEPMKPINGPATCGMDHPFRLTAFDKGTVALSSRAVLACPAISTVDTWFEEVVQPAADTYFGTRVAAVNAGSYSCRNMNNQRGGRISEHSFGNAIDLMSLTLADGRTISVEKGWRGSIAEQDFLREIFLGACRYFTTVLAPGSNIYHYNHIHMDLARHAKGRSICKPIIKWTPRIPADRQPELSPSYETSAAPARPPRAGAGQPDDEALPEEGPDEPSTQEASRELPTAKARPQAAYSPSTIRDLLQKY